MSIQQGGNRERCCKDCYNQHSAVVERHPQEEVTHSTPGTPFRRFLQAGLAVSGVSGSLLHTHWINVSKDKIFTYLIYTGDTVVIYTLQ